MMSMAVFKNNTNSKNSDFEKWLSSNGYFYIKTKDNRPCFKSKLTQNLFKLFQNEKSQNKLPSKYLQTKIFSFKFGG